MGDRPLIAICGPTGTGKTSLGFKLCHPPAGGFNGEIVSIDSRQLYKGLEIGSGKAVASSKYQVLRGDGYWDVRSREAGSAVRIHLYDLIEPDEELNVVQFAKIAGPMIERIWARGKIPFLVGGAGLYFEVLLGQVAVAKVDPDPRLRRRLEELSNEELFLRLKGLDPERAESIDSHSPHRLMRAIEIAIGRKNTGRKSGIVEVLPPDLEPLWIGLDAPRELLYEKIDRRVGEMVAAGLLDEVQTLVEKYGWKVPALNSIGYIEFKPYFEGGATLEECVVRAKFNTHAYARRQLTWFRRNKNIKWFDIMEDGFEEKVGEMVELYLGKLKVKSVKRKATVQN